MSGPRTDASMLPFLVAGIGIFLLTLMDLVIKGLTASFTTTEIVAARYTIAALAAAALFVWLRTPWPDAVSFRANAVRACVMLTTAWLFFFSLGRIPLAEAFALAFTAPVFVALLGRAILGEPVRPSTWLAIGLGLSGAMVVLWGQFSGPAATGDMAGYLAAIASAVTYALVMVMIRKQSAREGFVSFITQQNVYATPVALALLAGLSMTGGLAPYQALDGPSAGLFVAAGLLGVAGQMALGYAWSRAEAARLGVLEYTGFIWGAGLAFVVFDEMPAPATIVGVVLIVSGAILSARR
jgi:S-adenosylmethionine uptake transporter